MRWLKILRSPLLWGSLLIVGGVLLLIQNFTGLQLGNAFWGAVLVLAGLIFISLTQGPDRPWWPYIPGISLLATGSLVLLSIFLPGSLMAPIGGLLGLGGVAIGFLCVYLAERRNWWAIIPAGVLATLATIAFLDTTNIRFIETGGLFFLGLGLTFLAVALLPTPAGDMRWAYIPAAILLAFGLLLTASMADLLVWIIPGGLLLGGLYLVIRAMRK